MIDPLIDPLIVVGIGVLIALLCYFLIYDKAPALEQTTTDPNDPANDPIAAHEREREHDKAHFNGTIGIGVGSLVACIGLFFVGINIRSHFEKQNTVEATVEATVAAKVGTT